MVNESIELSWRALESINASMHEAASTHNWLTVLELATKRHAMLQEHFNTHPVGPNNADFYRRHMDKLVRGESELQTAVRDARKALMSEGLQLHHQQRALGAYLNAATN